MRTFEDVQAPRLCAGSWPLLPEAHKQRNWRPVTVGPIPVVGALQRLGCTGALSGRRL